MPSTDDEPPLFTSTDWPQQSGGLRAVRLRTVGLATALLVLAVLFAYDYVASPNALVATWDVTRMDWLFLVSAVLATRYSVVPLVADRDRTTTYVTEFSNHPVGVLSFAYLVAFGVLGIVGPEWFGLARVDFATKLQPPVFTSVSADGIHAYNCVGEMVNERCHGTWSYPLGTTRVGEDLIRIILFGMHIAFKLALSAGILMVVVATAVGTAAGYFGGRVDDVLMWYVDVQQTIPAIIVYIIFATLYLGKGLFALALVFGLFDWGGIARLVRSETIKRRQSGYVRAARSAGASDLRVVRKHVIPNASSTIVTTLTRQLPVLILIQVALSYLKLNEVNRRSLGEILLRALSDNPVPWLQKWWITASIVVFLVTTVVAFNLFGDAVSDILDPHDEGV